MNTSYFAMVKKIKSHVSISRYSPKWYDGPSYSALSPSLGIFSDYKYTAIDSETYERRFNEEILAKLNAQDVYSELTSKYGDDVALLCYEHPRTFCHRKVVAKWFESELGILVPELTFK